MTFRNMKYHAQEKYPNQCGWAEWLDELAQKKTQHEAFWWKCKMLSNIK